MLIPFGVFSAAGAGGGAAAGSYELISSTILSSTASTVTFSSIVGTYKHLQVRYVVQNANASTSTQNISLNINGSSSSIYKTHILRGDGSSVTSSAPTDSTYNFFELTIPSANNTSVFSPGIIDFLDYASTSKNKTLRALTGNIPATSKNVQLFSGLFASTSAISSLSFTTSAANGFNTGSRFSLYGIKG